MYNGLSWGAKGHLKPSDRSTAFAAVLFVRHLRRRAINAAMTEPPIQAGGMLRAEN